MNPGRRGYDLVVTFAPGSAADVIARTLAAALEGHLGEPVRILNKIADAGAEGYRYVKEAPPDGQTLIWNATALLTMIHLGTLDFDHRAFQGVARITVDPLSLVVTADAPWATLGSFVEYVNTIPGVKVGHEGRGTFAHLVAASLEEAARITFTHIPSGAARESVNALREKRIEASVQAVAGVVQAARERKIRILGVSGGDRSPALPDVPTFREQGVPLAMEIWRGVAVPQGTPGEAIARLESACEKAIREASFVDASRRYGFAIRYLGSADFDAFIHEQDAIIRGIMQRLGMKKAIRP